MNHAALPLSCPLCLLRILPVIPALVILFAHFLAFSRISSSSCSLIMDAEPLDDSEKPFACDVCGHHFETTGSLRSHESAHTDVVHKCLRPKCVFSSSQKTDVMRHLKGFHGTAGSFACDHPGCTFLTTWEGNIAQHKQRVHIDAKPFASTTDHNGCGFRSNANGDLSCHKIVVHLNIRDKRCHVCGKGFYTKTQLMQHMVTHEGDGHEVAKCEDCPVNLRSKWSRKASPAAGQLFLCEHEVCDYQSRWKNNVSKHQKQVHSEERPFSCNYTGCSFRCKQKNTLTNHENRFHLKVKTKGCHICNKRFFWKAYLRAHMLSNHQTDAHDVDECDDCVTNLKKNERMSRAVVASRKRKAEREGKGTNSTTANKRFIENHKRKLAGNEEVACREAHAKSETTNSLNDDLIDMHMDMQLLSSL